MVRKLRGAPRPPRWVIYLSAFLFAALLALIIYIKWPKPEPPVYPTVQAEPLSVEDVEIYVEYAGKIRAKQHVEIRARVEGYLEKMYFDEGGYVKKNALLFSIDPKLYRARVEKAKAQLNKNQALKQKAERDLQRIRPLYEQNAASQLDLDNAVAAFEAAQAEVIMSEADLAQAEIALSYTEVRSPISGFISESSADIGTLVGPGGKSLLATVVSSDTVQVNFSMTGLDYLKSKERNVNLGKRIEERNWNPYITITLADNTEYPIKGMVDFADPKVDPNTDTFSVRAQMPNPDHILLPGQLTKVRLLMDVHENAIVVPKKALVIEKGGAYVFVVRKDLIVEKRFVELGPEVENRVVVERGLGVDEMIIVEGFHKLSHGMRVNYEYMVSNQITPFVKYNMFHAEMKRKRRKNAFLIENMFYNKELDFYICPMGQHLEFVKQIKEKSDLGYESTKSVYRAKDCSRCPLRSMCYKGKHNARTIEVNHRNNELRAMARELLTSDEGLMHRSRRPIEPEAVFGQIKYDNHFKRFSYRGKRLVNAEFAAIAVAHNIRKMIAKGYCVCSEVAVG